MNAIISIISHHVKALMGVVIALVAFVECLTTGIVTSTISLFGIQSSVINTMVVAPTSLLNTLTMSAPPYVMDIASRIFVTFMGPITAFLDLLAKIGGMGIEQFGQFIGWLLDFIVKSIMFIADKITMCIDLVIRLINTMYQMVYQFFSQSINAIIDRIVYFLARKPWGSFGETPLGMRCQEKLRVYCYIRYQRWRVRYTKMVKDAKKFNNAHDYDHIKRMVGQEYDYGNLKNL